MKVERANIAEQSLIYGHSLNADYSECYQMMTNEKTVTLETCLASFLLKPKWVDFLYKLRNTLVKPFGLDASTDKVTDFNSQKGGKLSFFDVLERNDTEILLNANDKHLEAWFSIQTESNRNQSVVKITTVVAFHNLMGKIYFSIIKPFHYLIVKDMLNRMCR